MLVLDISIHATKFSCKLVDQTRAINHTPTHTSTHAITYIPANTKLLLQRALTKLDQSTIQSQEHVLVI